MPIPDPITKPPDPLALFVRAKRDHIVRRFGSLSAIGYTFIPGTKDKPSEHRWDEETIHAITTEEYESYRKEYEAELGAGGGLIRCSRKDWEKQVKHRRAEHDKTKAERKADEAKRAKEPATPAGSER